MAAETRHCVQCGVVFFLRDDTRAWFVARHMALPKRYPSCRRTRRLNQTTNESARVADERRAAQ